MEQDSVETSRQNHSTCRVNESIKLKLKDDALADMNLFITNIPTAPLLPTSHDAQLNLEYLAKIRSELCSPGPGLLAYCTKDRLKTKKDAHDNAASTHDSTRQSCHHKQSQFEENYCLWREKIFLVCKTLKE